MEKNKKNQNKTKQSVFSLPSLGKTFMYTCGTDAYSSSDHRRVNWLLWAYFAASSNVAIYKTSLNTLAFLRLLHIRIVWSSSRIVRPIIATFSPFRYMYSLKMECGRARHLKKPFRCKTHCEKSSAEGRKRFPWRTTIVKIMDSRVVKSRAVFY